MPIPEQIESHGLLKKILLKICRRHERRGRLSGVMKLGENLAADELRQLNNFFGLHPLMHNAKGELRLSFDLLPVSENPEKFETWLKQIYRLCQREPPKDISWEQEAQTLRERLRLSYPELDAIHHHLARQDISLARQLQKDEITCKDFLFKAARIVHFLLENNQDLTLSDLGARFCENSKELRQGSLKNTVAQWLHLMRPDLPPEEDIWREFQIIQDHLSISALLYAPLVYEKNNRRYDWIRQLYEAGEPALLSPYHLEGINACSLPESFELISCENEAPYSQLLRQQKNAVLLSTSGFPNRAVCELYRLLSPLAARCRHWGDSDPAGLQIAAILHHIHPLTLWRCDLPTLKQHRHKLLPLLASQRAFAQSALEEATHFPFPQELAFTLENGWLEQESWENPAG